MTPDEASAALGDSKIVLVDVREPAEVAQMRISGSVNIPLAELPARLSELGADRPVAFLCRSGGRSAKATALATKAGLDAINVSGGINSWQRAGLTIKTGR